MKIIELNLEDLECLKEGWHLLKRYKELEPKFASDNTVLISLNPLDQDISKLIAQGDLRVKVVDLD